VDENDLKRIFNGEQILHIAKVTSRSTKMRLEEQTLVRKNGNENANILKSLDCRRRRKRTCINEIEK
jgi:hypothetical protein